MTVALPSPLLLATLLLVAACGAERPAAERGFFGGIGAAITGEDERQARAREAEATAAETRALQARAAAIEAERRQAASAAALRDAERRLAALEGEIARLKRALAEARAGRPNDPQGAVLQDRLERLDRERAAAARRPDPATADRLERQSRELNRALEAYGRL
ncbi:hypothetical protein KO353_02625 [Elioraea tepida]|uniref:Lipoprotein n=1 Tax=Elioraea tepida TaxID=2843330 RepID=A0A975YJZ3_9PROT|nr:hypothetical protein [Elioraea tepida]QXM25166.1 hypothetical protein KO353_02625 [Elioraea tepida]